MTRRMIIDATHPEETRVAVVNGTRLEEFDYETEFRKQLKSNIYLAKVTRVEPSLQAAFVEYGGNRHAFLPFPEIHSDYYRIPIGDRPHGYDDHDDDDNDASIEQFPEGALSGESAQALHQAYPDEISEAFESVRYSFQHDEQPQDYADSDHGETQHVDGAVPALDEHHGAYHESDAGEHDYQQGDESQPAGEAEHGPSQPQVKTVETVGGDEVDEMQHRRRSSMPRYKIQEVIKRRQIMLIQISKEERGNKGAAVTTFLSLPGRYCVLMPNTPRGGGISRKIANPQDRKRMKELIGDLELPPGMSVILRTAGVERSKIEIKRDLDYLLRLWEAVRDLTLRSTAPALVYEEGNLIKRSIRDIYGKDITDIQVAGEEGYRQAKDFMRMLMPSHARRVQLYRDPVPLFFRYQVESQIDAIHNPVAQLRSGGYIVINQTEALVSIDVNSGRSTRERNIEETAYKTNLEAADEIARQLRLRDMGGLIVIDFIDMEDQRHDTAVERRLKDAMRNDRARIQIGRVSAFGLLELSRQRLHPSLLESNFHTCPACRGAGIVRSMESAAFVALRAIEEEGIKGKAAEIAFHVHPSVALYVLNSKRRNLMTLEERYALKITVEADGSLISPDYRIERLRAHPPGFVPPVMLQPLPEIEEEEDDLPDEDVAETEDFAESRDADGEQGGNRRGGRRRRSRGRRSGGPSDRMGDSSGEQQSASFGGLEEEGHEGAAQIGEQPDFTYPPEAVPTGETSPLGERSGRRRRGRRGGRKRQGGEQSSDLNAFGEQGQDGEAFEEAAQGANDPFSPEYEEHEAFSGPQVSPEPEPVTSEQHADITESVMSGPSSAQTIEATQAAPRREPETSSPAVRDYETVNQEPESPRQGWWKRLIQ